MTEDAPNASDAPSLSAPGSVSLPSEANGAPLKENEPTIPSEKNSNAGAQSIPPSSVSALHSARRSERIRHQAARAEEQRLIREERAAMEQAKAKARSVAAKKAADTKKKAAQGDSDETPLPGARQVTPGQSGASSRGSSRSTKKIMAFKYLNCAEPPKALQRIDLGETPRELFWLRLNLRDFLYRFDKLCRLPARFGTTINDPLQAYAPEQLKTIALALLKLIANDSTPIHSRVRDHIAEIENLDAHNPGIWDWLLSFVEHLDPYAPQEVPTTEQEKLELLRRLMVLSTGTETIRITVTSDVDQLKWVEKDSQDEIKAIQSKLKETESKLAKLKSVDKSVWQEKVDAARRAAQNKIVKAQAQLFSKQHKYNMRTAPLITDPLGNRYWSFQYKSSTHSEWGSWIICEILRRPSDIHKWNVNLGNDVNRVLAGRDELIQEKNEERRVKRAKQKQTVEPKEELKQVSEVPEQASANGNLVVNSQSTSPSNEQSPRVEPNEQSIISAPKEEHVDPGEDVDNGSAVYSEAPAHGKKRKYPKLKLQPLPAFSEPELYYIQGRENILALADWLGNFARVDQAGITELVNVASYLSQDE